MVLSALPPGLSWLSTKPMRVIRMTAVLLVCCLHLSASFSQSVTLRVKNAPLKEVFAALKKQTGFSFFYNAELLTDAKPVTLNMQNASLTEVLKAAFNGQPLNYVIENKTVFISRVAATVPAPSNNKNIMELLAADPVKIRVTDADGQPLSGATVTLVKSKKSTTTDAQGNITVNGDAGDVVLISYVGYETQEVKLGGKNSVLVVLKAKQNSSEEVIVMAYGQKKKRSEVVGSAFQINAERIDKMPAARLDALLEGQIPGLRITPNTDDAASTKQRLNLRIRGTGSFSASNEPLWVIDGTPVFTGDRTNLIPGIQTAVSPLSYINPEDIQSISVLKDAAAAAIYGANASNGVILVTTKSGTAAKPGEVIKPKLSLSLQNGFSKINKSTKFKTLNGAEYMELAKESFLNAGKEIAAFPYNDNEANSYSNTNTDWTDVYYGTGIINNATLSLRGGTEKLAYRVSGGFFNSKSTVIGNTQTRASGNANLTYKINKNLDISLITRYSWNKNNTFNPGTDYLDNLPIYSPYNNDGSFRMYNRKISGLDVNGNPEYRNERFFNYVAQREENDDVQKGNVFNNNLMVGYQIMKGLKSTTQYGIDFQDVKQRIYNARTNWSGVNSAGVPTGYAQGITSKSTIQTLIERLEYNKYFGLHNINVLAGVELLMKKSDVHGISGGGFDDDNHRDVKYAKSISSEYRNKNEDKNASYFGQVGYDFDKRYYVILTGRRDGSSTFGSDSRWGDFGSVGVNWNIKNDLLRENDKVNDLSIGATYGITGNSRLSQQETFGIYSFKSNDFYDGTPASTLSNIPNSLLRWESAKQWNLKLNLELFHRIYILAEAYRKTTVDAIVNVPVSRTTGATSAQSNTGELRNEGIETTIRWDVIDRPSSGFRWTVELNAAHNKNKALKLYNENDKTNGNFIWREGFDLNTYYLIRWAGVDPRDGAPLWYDANGNLTRTYNIANRVAGVSSQPDVFGGFRTEFKYKDFTLSALFSYSIGGYQFSSFSRGINSDGLNIEDDNQSVNQLDRWQQPGDVAVNPKPIWGVTTQSTMNSTRYLFKTTNVRLSNAVLGYILPEATTKKLGVKGCSVSLVGNELLFWTPYEKANRNSFKQSRSGYPLETSFLLALNVTF